MEAHQVLIIEDTDKNKEIPKVEDFHNICRICLINFDNPEVVKKSFEETADEIRIKSLLQSYTPIQLSSYEENLPQNICLPCIKYLIDIHIFHSRCLLNEDLLHKLWKASMDSTLDIKQEAEECNSNEHEDILNLIEDDIDDIKDVFVFDESTKNTINEINEDLLGLHKCDKCPAQFPTQLELKEHKRKTKHPRKPKVKGPCPYCGKLFNTTALKYHIPTHTKEKPFVCEHCNAEFSGKQSWRRHLRIHLDVKPKCEICGRVFSTMDTLFNHWRTHADQNRFIFDNVNNMFQCFLCKKLYDTEDKINAHLKKHEASHLCSHCGKKYTSKWEFDIHMRKHTGEKPFKCDLCNKLFADEENLKLHEITKCGEALFECEYCEKKFRTQAGLGNHKAIHTESLTCWICDKTFDKRSKLNLHLAVHKGLTTYDCTECHRQFYLRSSLDKHLRSHFGERAFACEFCGKQFAVKGNLSKHQLLHTGGFPHKCRVCGKGYRDTSNRKTHEEKRHTALELKLAINQTEKHDENDD